MKKDVFLSYASRDAEQIENIVQALEETGISVWWDRQIPPGKTWDAVLGKALNEARCVIVLWTGNSIHSDWVKDEAARGKQRNILVPALLEDVEIPLGFGRIEAADLRNWDGDTTDPEFIHFINAIRSVVSGEQIDITETQSSLPHWKPVHFKLWQLLIPLLIIVAAVTAWKLIDLRTLELVTELWRVESDLKNRLLASNTFTGEADLDKVSAWLVQELNEIAPVIGSPIQVNLNVPADLNSETVQVTTDPALELGTYLYVTSDTNKARSRSALTRKRLALMEEDFYIEFTHPGYQSEAVKITPGEEKIKSFELNPKRIAIAVEHFNNDKNNTAARLSRKLAEHAHLKVTNPDALENLRKQIKDVMENMPGNIAIQGPMRDSLGVDFIISGAVEKK